jgi:hypothetical protein
MARVMLVVALALGMSAGCKKKMKDDDGPYSGGGNPTPGGAAQAVRGAVNRTVTAAELHDLHIFMTYAKGSLGRVPTYQETWDMLNKPDGNPKLVALIKDGSIIMVPNPQDEGLWAYGKDVPTQGGMILTHTGVERVTAADYRTRFGGN